MRAPRVELCPIRDIRSDSVAPDCAVRVGEAPQFRRGAVELARRADTSVAQVAKDLGTSESCLRRWLRATTSTPVVSRA